MKGNVITLLPTTPRPHRERRPADYIPHIIVLPVVRIERYPGRLPDEIGRRTRRRRKP